MAPPRDRPLDRCLDAVLVVLALALHLGGAARLDALPPSDAFETVLVGLPVLAQVVALGLLTTGERRGLAGACLLQWLLVLYTLPASFLGLSFVPAALALTVALYRPRVSSARPDAG